MLPDEYASICDKIINSTMQNIDTSAMQRLICGKTAVSADNTEYDNAVVDSAPISLIYAPSGTGRYSLVTDRINALLEEHHNVLALTMNISRAAQLNNSTSALCQTFSDFTFNLLNANLSVNFTDHESFINMIKLEIDEDEIKSKFISILKIQNPQERMTITTLFVNKHIDWITKAIIKIKHITTKLACIICQNMVWHFKNTPYEYVSAIVIDGVHNMPIPALCTILAYASRYHCNLFMMGCPEETIYEFNMAYRNAMNVLSAYTDKNIHVIRLSKKIKMDANISNVLDMNAQPVGNIAYANVQYWNDDEIRSVLHHTLDPNTAYIRQKLANKEKLLFIARSKQEMTEIANIIYEKYLAKYPDLKIIDLIAPAENKTHYGQIAVKHNNRMIQTLPEMVTVGQYFYELYNIMAEEYSGMPDSIEKHEYKTQMAALHGFAEEIYGNLSFGALDFVSEFTKRIVEYESGRSMAYMSEMEQKESQNMKGADIILSTIHAAIDIRCDNAVIFLRNQSENIDKNLYRVALSRANKSEYIIFANKGRFETSYQRYLKQNVVK